MPPGRTSTTGCGEHGVVTNTNDNPHAESIALAVQMMARARDEYEAMFDGTPRNRLIKAMAKCMCRAEGHDPGAIVSGIANCGPVVGPKNTAGIFAPIAPSWFAYWTQARTALETVEEVRPDFVP